MMLFRICRSFAAAALALSLGGCSAIDFYWQGMTGQMNLIAGARPISEVLETTNDPLLRERLLQVQQIRKFAIHELGLPDNSSYTRYTDLGRPYVVWNVVATPELSLAPRQWCFAIVGCVSYRGYFNETDARIEAQRLAGRGDDVNLGGVPAYSTLGWFDDPVLSSFVRYRETELARLLFHELAHQIVYVKDDTAFNESFAVAVEEEGLRRWLAAQRNRKDAAQLADEVARTRVLRNDFRRLVRSTRDRLRDLYASRASDAKKRAGKAQAFADMKAEYERMKEGWGGIPAYDRWFATAANNAGIASVGLYADHVPEFAALIAHDSHDMRRFYQDVKALAALPAPQREARLASFAPPAPVASAADVITTSGPSAPLLSTGSGPGTLAP